MPSMAVPMRTAMSATSCCPDQQARKMLLVYALDTTKKHTMPPLVVAILNQAPDLARRLLRLGADPSEPIDTQGHTALHIAVAWSMAWAVEMLLDRGMDPNVEVRGIPLLCLAVQCDEFKVVQSLLVHGANVHTRTAHGGTPLFLSILSGGTFVDLLVEYGADVNSKVFRHSCLYHTILSEYPDHLAKLPSDSTHQKDTSASAKRLYTVARLAHHGVEVDRASAIATVVLGHLSILKLLIECSAVRTKYLKEALRIALELGDEQATEMLVTSRVTLQHPPRVLPQPIVKHAVAALQVRDVFYKVMHKSLLGIFEENRYEIVRRIALAAAILPSCGVGMYSEIANTSSSS